MLLQSPEKMCGIYFLSFQVNGTSYTVLRLLGEGGYSQVLTTFKLLKLLGFSTFKILGFQLFIQIRLTLSGVRGVQCRKGSLCSKDC